MMKILSIIIPAYNEEATLLKLINILLKINLEINGFKKEIIIIDDGSTDRTYEIAKNAADKYTFVQVIQQINYGKGRAVQNGIKICSGEYVIIQDADLEYDPNDYCELLSKLNNKGIVVYGSRILGQIKYNKNKFPFIGKHPKQSIGPWIASIILTFWVYTLYGSWITDTLTAYKLYPTKLIRDLNITSDGFEADHEITSKLLKNNIKIIEIPIKYNPRTKIEGKKIKFTDGIIAIWTFFRFKFH